MSGGFILISTMLFTPITSFDSYIQLFFDTWKIWWFRTILGCRNSFVVPFWRPLSCFTSFGSGKYFVNWYQLLVLRASTKHLSTAWKREKTKQNKTDESQCPGQIRPAVVPEKFKSALTPHNSSKTPQICSVSIDAMKPAILEKKTAYFLERKTDLKNNLMMQWLLDSSYERVSTCT